MRFLIGLILLAFPFAELFLLVKLGQAYGWWLLVYLVVITYLGLQLIKGERLLLSAKMMQSFSAGGNPFKTMLGSARNMAAGVLLVIPGVITDIIAAVLLLIPFSKPNLGNEHLGGATNNSQYQKAANDDVIEGEYVEIIEETDKLK